MLSQQEVANNPTVKTPFGADKLAAVEVKQYDYLWDSYHILTTGANILPREVDFFTFAQNQNGSGYTPKTSIETNMVEAQKMPYGYTVTVLGMAFQVISETNYNTAANNKNIYNFLQAILEDSLVEFYLQDVKKAEVASSRVGGLGHLTFEPGNINGTYIANGERGRDNYYKFTTPIPIAAQERFKAKIKFNPNNALLIAAMPQIDAQTNQYYEIKFYLIVNKTRPIDS